MQCPKCKSTVDFSSSNCPNCGFPLLPMATIDVKNSKVEEKKELNNQNVSQVSSINENIPPQMVSPVSNLGSNQPVESVATLVNQTIDSVPNQPVDNVANQLVESVSKTNLNQNTETNQQQEVNNKKKKKEKMNKKQLKTNENKSKKRVNKKVVVLFILVVILLGVIGFLLYYIFMGKEDTKEIVVNNDSTLIESTLSDQEAVGLGESLWNYSYDTIWCKKFTYAEEPVTLSDGKQGYEITNYDDVKSLFSEDFKYKYGDQSLGFNDIFGNVELEKKYYDSDKCSRNASIDYYKTDITAKEIKSDKIVYQAQSKYCENALVECTEDNATKNVDNEFSIIKSADKWVIQSFVLPD